MTVSPPDLESRITWSDNTADIAEEYAPPPPTAQSCTGSEINNRKRKTRSYSDVSLPSKRSRLATTPSADQFSFRLPIELDFPIRGSDDNCDPFIIVGPLSRKVSPYA